LGQLDVLAEISICGLRSPRLHLRDLPNCHFRIKTFGLGGGSTHAWCQIYLPGAGWIEFDPTNGVTDESGRRAGYPALFPTGPIASEAIFDISAPPRISKTAREIN
jgi:hypothetical protein